MKHRSRAHPRSDIPMPRPTRHLLTSLALSAIPALAGAQASSTPDPLLGIWTSETTFGPQLAGELTIRRNGTEWRATIRSAESRFRVAHDSVRFAFGEQGELRGTLVDA